MSKSDRAEVLFGLPIIGSRWQTVVTVTPDLARIILDLQPRQRALNFRSLTKLKDAIKGGKWERTHQGIAFDEDGLLSDGQHRLTACLQAGIPIEVMAHFNEPRKMFHTYDAGAARNMGTHMFLGGLTDTPSVAKFLSPAAKFVWGYDIGTNPTYANSRINFTYEAAKMVVEAHPLLVPTIKSICVRPPAGIPVSALGALLTMMREGDAERGELFMHQVMTGENIRVGDPAHTLRETSSRFRFSYTEISYRIARSWNAFYEGRPLTRLYGSVTSNTNKVRTMDAFPEIAGYTRPDMSKAA